MAQRSLSDLSKKVIPVAATIVIFLLFVFATIATKNILPFWQYGTGALLLLVVIGWLLLKKTVAAPPQQAGQPNKYFGWIKTTPKQLVYTGIAVVVIGLVLYFGIFEVPDKTFSAEELLKYKVSGNCQKQGDELVCSGPWKIFIPDPDKKIIGKLTVVPGTESLKEIMIQAGSYRVDYSQGDLKQFGGTICGYAVKGIYHRAMIYYDDKPKIQNCYPVGVPTGMAPENLYFGTTWLRLITPGFFNPEDPQFYVGWEIISRSYINDNRQKYLGGDITISGQQSARIKSLNVVYSSYRII